MDMGMDFGTPLGFAAAGGGILAVIAQQAWSKFFGEGRSNTLLVTQLTERISSQEARLQLLESGLDNERTMRRLAEDKVQVLQLYVMKLKATLQQHGITVPELERIDRIDEE